MTKRFQLLAVLICAAVLGQSAVADAWEDLASYRYGDESKAAEKAMAVLQDTPVEKHGVIEEKLIAVIEAEDAETDGKAFACRMLQQIGTEKSISALSDLLTDEILSHYARLPLERMRDSSKAGSALLKALGKAPDKAKTGIIMSLGERGDSKAVRTINKYVSNDDADTAAAAMRALGKIGGSSAARYLSKAKVTGKLEGIRQESLIRCAATLSASKATDILQEVYREGTDVQRVAALRALIEANEAEGTEIIVDLLKGENSHVQAGALQLLTTVKGADMVKQVAAALPAMPVPAQVKVLGSLSQRGDCSVAKQVVALLNSDSAEVRRAAISAVGRLGSAACVQELLISIQSSDASTAELATKALAAMTAPGVNDRLIELVADSEAGVAAMKVLALRNCVEARPTLFELTDSADPKLSSAALSALAELGLGDDGMNKLVTSAIGTEDAARKNRLLQALKTIFARGDRRRYFTVLAPKYQVADEATKLAILEMASQAGDSQALDLVRKEIASETKPLRDAAVRSLTKWNDRSAIPILVEIAEKSDAEVHRVLSVRACLRLANTFSGRDRNREKEQLKIYRSVIKFVTRPDEQKQMISALRNVRMVKSLKMLEEYLGDEHVNAEAEIASCDLAWDLRGSHPAEVATIAQKLIDTSTNKKVTDKATKTLAEAQKKLKK